MIKTITILTLFCLNTILTLAQTGSGTCLKFTGNNYVDCGNPTGNFFDFIGNGTIEAWVKISNTPPPADSLTCYSILSKDESAGEFNKWIFGVQNGKLAFHINSPDANHNWVYSNRFVLVLDKYYHFAVTKNINNEVTFYVNGTFMGTFILPHQTTYVNSGMMIGGSEPGLEMDGEIDEVRFWKKVLTKNEVRDWMCRKISLSHPAYSDLIACYSFNEGAGLITNNYKGSVAALFNSPLWSISAAPIGDSAANDFVKTNKSTTIKNSFGETLQHQ